MNDEWLKWIEHGRLNTFLTTLLLKSDSYNLVNLWEAGECWGGACTWLGSHSNFICWLNWKRLGEILRDDYGGVQNGRNPARWYACKRTRGRTCLWISLFQYNYYKEESTTKLRFLSQVVPFFQSSSRRDALVRSRFCLWSLHDAVPRSLWRIRNQNRITRRHLLDDERRWKSETTGREISKRNRKFDGRFHPAIARSRSRFFAGFCRSKGKHP